MDIMQTYTACQMVKCLNGSTLLIVLIITSIKCPSGTGVKKKKRFEIQKCKTNNNNNNNNKTENQVNVTAHQCNLTQQTIHRQVNQTALPTTFQTWVFVFLMEIAGISNRLKKHFLSWRMIREGISYFEPKLTISRPAFHLSSLACFTSPLRSFLFIHVGCRRFPYPMRDIYHILNNCFLKRPITLDYSDPSSSLGVLHKDLYTKFMIFICDAGYTCM